MLTTARLIPREFVADDWPALLAYQSDPRYLRYYHWTGRTPAEVQDFVGTFLAQQQAEPRLKRQLAVTFKDTGELIGNCGLSMRDGLPYNKRLRATNTNFPVQIPGRPLFPPDVNLPPAGRGAPR